MKRQRHLRFILFSVLFLVLLVPLGNAQVAGRTGRRVAPERQPEAVVEISKFEGLDRKSLVNTPEFELRSGGRRSATAPWAPCVPARSGGPAHGDTPDVVIG